MTTTSVLSHRDKFNLNIQYNDIPRFCIISPTAYLDQFASQSDSHLALAHLVKSDAAYADFYKRMAARGDRIIMDNGAFELGSSYNPSELITLAEMCGADAIVLPDYPGRSSIETIHAAEQILPDVISAGLATMFVPQSAYGDREDWISAYSWASDNPDVDIIGMSILGIPSALRWIERAYARVVMSTILEERGLFNHKKHHHYLGLNAGPNVELSTLIDMGWVNTCDSSNPVWAGLSGYEYNESFTDWLGVRKNMLHSVDFNMSQQLSDEQINRIQHNLDLTLDLFKCEG